MLFHWPPPRRRARYGAMAVMISILSIMIGFSFIADRGDWTDAGRHAGGVSIAIGPAQRASLVALPPIAGAHDSRRPLGPRRDAVPVEGA